MTNYLQTKAAIYIWLQIWRQFIISVIVKCNLSLHSGVATAPIQNWRLTCLEKTVSPDQNSCKMGHARCDSIRLVVHNARTDERTPGRAKGVTQVRLNYCCHSHLRQLSEHSLSKKKKHLSEHCNRTVSESSSCMRCSGKKIQTNVTVI
jgi:hypothetical protein